MKPTKSNAKKTPRPKGKGKKVYVKPSKPFYRKASEVDDHDRSGSKNVKIEGHYRNKRRTKKQIKLWGTRDKPFSKKKTKSKKGNK